MEYNTGCTGSILRMSWAWLVARIGERIEYAVFWWGNLRVRDHLGDPGLDGKIILKCIFMMGGTGLDRAGSV